MTKEELSYAVKSFCDHAWASIIDKPKGKDTEEQRKKFEEEVKLIVATIVDINLKLTSKQKMFPKWTVDLEEIEVPKLLSGFVEPYSVKFADDDESAELLVRTPNIQTKMLMDYDSYHLAVKTFGNRMHGNGNWKQMETVSMASLRRTMLFNDAYIYSEYQVDGVNCVRKMEGGFLPINLRSFTKDFWLEDTYSKAATDMIDKYCMHLFK